MNRETKIRILMISRIVMATFFLVILLLGYFFPVVFDLYGKSIFYITIAIFILAVITFPPFIKL